VSDIEAVRNAAERALGAGITDMRSVCGGELNDAYALELADGRRLFLKTSPGAQLGSFIAEGAGLSWIADADGGPLVPGVVAVVDANELPASGEAAPSQAPRMLILSWVTTAAMSGGAAERLGRELANLHRAGAPAHGAPPPAVRGASEAMFLGPIGFQANSDPALSWPEVYANLRVLPVARLAHERGALPGGGLRMVESLCGRLHELSGPAEPPSRLHGDLWGGNVIADSFGVPYLIDPAAYGGHREVDLAMLRLFGGPGERCFAAYQEAYPLSDGHRERVALWQLFPTLLHAALFGGGYGPRAVQIAKRYL
jgi:fructosamine-3-kinase